MATSYAELTGDGPTGTPAEIQLISRRLSAVGAAVHLSPAVQ